LHQFASIILTVDETKKKLIVIAFKGGRKGEKEVRLDPSRLSPIAAGGGKRKSQTALFIDPRRGRTGEKENDGYTLFDGECCQREKGKGS